MFNRVVNISTIFIVFLSFTEILAQEPDTSWTRHFGTDSSESGISVEQANAGGFIITGFTEYENGSKDVYLLKTDSLGDSLWTKTFGNSGDEYGNSIQQTSDDGYIITGMTASYGAGDYDVYLIKTNSGGDSLWTKTFGDSGTEMGYSVKQTHDNGYIIAGYKNYYGTENYDICLIKTDSSGNEEWSKTLGGDSLESGNSVYQTTDNGYIITGFTNSNGAGDLYLIKTDSLGDTLWTKTYGGNHWDEGCSVCQTEDHGYIIVGLTYSYGAGECDIYLIKTDSSGNDEWTKTYGGSQFEEGHSVQQTSDGGYILAGYTESFSVGYYDVYIIKTDSSGNQKWTKTIGGNSYDVSSCIRQTKDGGYIATGHKGAFPGDVYLIKIEPEAGLKKITGNKTQLISSISPNPFSNKTWIEYKLLEKTDINISIYNILSQKVREIYSGKKNAGFHYVIWNGRNNSKDKLPTGIYILRIKTEEKTESRKLILVR